VGNITKVQFKKRTRHDNEVIKGLYNEETNTFNTKSLIEKNCTCKTPWYIKYLNPNWISALSISCYADFLEYLKL
jgi:hypothetical protein